MPLHPPELLKRRKSKRRVNWWAVVEAIRAEKPGLVVLERQGPMPRQGVSSTFSIGYQYGALTGVLCALGLPFELVEPAVWKRDMKLLGHDKSHSLDQARVLMPEIAHLISRQKDHGLAEAALIALWKVKHGTRRLAGQ
jgi:crossover junction endodeoxyribonuclease RuvC